MTWAVDDLGHLDLGSCFMKRHYDMFKVEETAREYYFGELQDLTAWDGTKVKGMGSERKYQHLVCMHGHDEPPLNPMTDIDIERVRLLPLLKAVVTGEVAADVYREVRKNKAVDKVEIVVDGPDEGYVVVLGCVGGHYVVRSAYPAAETYVKRVRARAALIGRNSL